MKILITVLLAALLTLTAFTFRDEEEYRMITHTGFALNENLEFEVSYGLINAGTAIVQTHSSYYKVNGRPCYKIDVFGNSKGALEVVAKIRDHWGAYVDTASIVPHISFRNILEGGYRHNEIVRFDHNTDMVEAKTFNFKENHFREPMYHKAPENIMDMISGYCYLRTIDYSKLSIGDTLTLSTFFEDSFYDLKILFGGRENLKTKFGKVKSIILIPIMPDNKIFAGENSITAWFSDDENKIPLKVKAELFVGSAEVNLDKYQGLKKDLKFIKD